ncbi:MATE family efflux transporter [Marinobacterium nitratireducens]|uniref:MATE family efflux transporter n=1 Tax=Marinobacterium nitratireducens TaxID=518897 RepID=A0A917Z7V8_9GAMM|nr:MATE family efflux transporter [Marinobacterium nitratireducens]GGO77524.1 MATE family efflux transporter [Marinobacterium nitratireducens]
MNIGITLRRELGRTLAIATPLILSSLLSMGIAITDVVMMAWLGSPVLAAGAAVSDFYSILVYLVGGILGALSAVLAESRGAGRDSDCAVWIAQSFRLALIMALPGALLIGAIPQLLQLIGAESEVVVAAGDYAPMLALTFVLLLLSRVWHQCFAAFEHTRTILGGMLISLPLNALGNYALMNGHWGLPELGLAGIGLSSVICAATLLLWYSLQARRAHWYRPVARLLLCNDSLRRSKLLRLGVPIGVTCLGETGVFLLATLLIAGFSLEELAAHTLTLRVAGVLYAVPLGLSQAATVRAGLAFGAKDPAAMVRVLRIQLWLALLWGLPLVLLLLEGRELLTLWLLPDAGGRPALLETASLLLLLLALLQPADNLATQVTGFLRGLQDTRRPMQLIICSQWLLALPLGLLLGHGAGLGATGIWLGLGSGVLLACAGLLLRLQPQLALASRRNAGPASAEPDPWQACA